MSNQVQNTKGVLALLLCPVPTLLVIGRSDKGRTAVPANIIAIVTILIFDENCIKRIGGNSVSSLYTVTELHLNKNYVKFTCVNALTNSINLSVFEISHHHLLSVPSGVGRAGRSLARFEFSGGKFHISTIDMSDYPSLNLMKINFLRTDSLVLRQLPSLTAIYAQDCNLC